MINILIDLNNFKIHPILLVTIFSATKITLNNLHTKNNKDFPDFSCLLDSLIVSLSNPS